AFFPRPWHYLFGHATHPDFVADPVCPGWHFFGPTDRKRGSQTTGCKLCRYRREGGTDDEERLRRSRHQKVHHRDHWNWRRTLRLRQRWLARHLLCERDHARRYEGGKIRPDQPSLP